jgi:hypothetical protein
MFNNKKQSTVYKYWPRYNSVQLAENCVSASVLSTYDDRSATLYRITANWNLQSRHRVILLQNCSTTCPLSLATMNPNAVNKPLFVQSAISGPSMRNKVKIYCLRTRFVTGRGFVFTVYSETTHVVCEHFNIIKISVFPHPVLPNAHKIPKVNPLITL